MLGVFWLVADFDAGMGSRCATIGVLRRARAMSGIKIVTFRKSHQLANDRKKTSACGKKALRCSGAYVWEDEQTICPSQYSGIRRLQNPAVFLLHVLRVVGIKGSRGQEQRPFRICTHLVVSERSLHVVSERSQCTFRRYFKSIWWRTRVRKSQR